jgi:simple sugar transport system permease protein
MSGTLIGVINGFFVHEFRLPAFLVTLATMFFARGLSFAICPEPVSIEHPMLEWLMDELGFSVSLPGLGQAWVPPTAVMLAVAVAAAIVVARWTGFGRNTFALGGSPSSALLMGVPVRRTTFGIYALSGTCGGVAGVATLLTDSAGKPNIGVGLELEAIAAVVIGGTLLTGGSGTVIGTLMGVLITAIVRSVIILDGSLSSPWQPIAIGLLLLLFIVLQRVFTTRLATR